MLYEKKTLRSINDIANDVIGKILNISDPFSTPLVVCHNSKVLQWFKDYFMKTRSEVLMNVGFVSIPDFINGIINPDSKVTVLDKNTLRDYIIRELLMPENYPDDPGFPKNYIFDGSAIKGRNLYEFAEKLAALYASYEFDNEDIGTFGWEAQLYAKVMESAEKDGFYSVKRLFEKRKKENSDLTFNRQAFIINNSRITALYADIIDRYCGSGTVLYEIDDAEPEIGKMPDAFSAPSVLREVEELHSLICQNIADDKTLRFNDFIVYAPDVNDYAATVNRVFKQDGVNYPYVPFRIVGELKEKKDMADSLAVLFDIANKRFFTRYDFYKFVRNSMLQYVHDYTDEDVEEWMKAIVETNTHRDGKNNDGIADDWNYLKNRLLTSLLVSDSAVIENTVTLNDGTETLPFGDMYLEPASMAKMIDIIGLLEEWLKLFCDDPEKVIFDKDALARFAERLDSIYSRKKKNGAENNYLYRTIREEIARITELYEKVPASTVLGLIMSAPDAFVSYPADMFSGGVTFLNLDCEDIVSANYIYVLGMSSKSLPRVDVASEIDMSQNHVKSEELDALSVRNILKNAEKVTFSFVNRNTKTDEEYYPSPLLRKYFFDYDSDGKTKKEKKIPAVSLDETRDYDALFTRKELKDKNYYIQLTTGADPAGTAEKQEAPDGSKTAPQEDPDEIVLTTKDVRKFLENTFVYKFNAMLRQNDDPEEKYTQEYDLIDDAPLSKYNSVKQMVMTDKVGDCKDKLMLEQAFPAGGLEEAYYDAYNETVVKSLREEIATGYSLLSLDLIVLNDGDRDWTLEQTLTVPVFRKENGCELWYLEPKESDVKARFYLSTYAVALMDIAGRSEYGTYKVHLYPRKEFEITPESAREILNSAEKIMTDFGNVRYMDIEFIDEIEKAANKANPEDKRPKSITEFVQKIGGQNGHYTWIYSGVDKMVNPYKDLGYGDADFSEAFASMYEKISAMIAFEM